MTVFVPGCVDFPVPVRCVWIGFPVAVRRARIASFLCVRSGGNNIFPAATCHDFADHDVTQRGALFVDGRRRGMRVHVVIGRNLTVAIHFQMLLLLLLLLLLCCCEQVFFASTVPAVPIVMGQRSRFHMLNFVTSKRGALFARSERVVRWRVNVRVWVYVLGMSTIHHVVVVARIQRHGVRHDFLQRVVVSPAVEQFTFLVCSRRGRMMIVHVWGVGDLHAVDGTGRRAAARCGKWRSAKGKRMFHHVAGFVKLLGRRKFADESRRALGRPVILKQQGLNICKGAVQDINNIWREINKTSYKSFKVAG